MNTAETLTLTSAAGDITAPTPYEACLIPFLNAKGWAGEQRHLIEALPHFNNLKDLLTFRVVLTNLGVPTVIETQRLAQVPDDLFPCLIQRDGAPCVVIRRLTSGEYQIFDPESQSSSAEAGPTGRIDICRVMEIDAEDQEQQEKSGWFRKALNRFRHEILAAIVLTAAINIISLATPLLSMAVYNNIAPTESTETLYFLVCAALLGLAYDNYLRWRRSNLIATFAARLNVTIQRYGFAQLLMLPLSMTETASVSVQVARLKQFENVQGVFAGNLATAILDAPFTLLFIIVIAILGGPLLLVPVCLAICCGLIAVVLMPLARRYTREAGRRRISTQELLRQSIWEREAIQGLGAERLWTKRAGATFRRGALARFQAASLDQLMHGIGQLLTALSGVMILLLGSLMVIDERLSIGALIAVMMLVWRVLAPIQTAFLASNQIINARDAIRQIDGLMQLQTDRDIDKAPSLFRKFRGEVRLDGLSFRYPSASDFALRGVSFAAKPGEMIGVAGPVGGGKSTLLRLMLGLHRPLSGTVYLDGMNLSQLDAGEIRATVGYSPERPKLFFGTVSQNIRLAHPSATEEEIAEILDALRLDLTSSVFPEGVETRLSSTQISRMSEGAIQRISLARALVKQAPILLLDDPAALLTPEETEALMAMLEARRGDTTTFLVSSDREQLSKCDRLLLLFQGQLVADGSPTEILANYSANR